MMTSLMEDWVSSFEPGAPACSCAGATPFDEASDWLVIAPSVFIAADIEARGELFEGKALGTAKEQDIVFLDKDQTVKAATDPEGDKWRRHQGVTVGKRKLDKAKSEAYPLVLNAIFAFQSGKLTEAQMRKAVVKAMKRAWKATFFAGVRSSGVPGDFGEKKWRLQTTPSDEKWLKSAMQHEMRFLNKMLKSIIEETYKMPLARRVRMYIDALESFYNSARVMGLPVNTLFHWRISPEGKRKETVCKSCLYLAKHSPYTKMTLPTTPRSGLTICLTNCRDKLVARRVDGEKVMAVTNASQYKKSGHIKNLRKLKRTGHI
jgi:hypothetical protein